MGLKNERQEMFEILRMMREKEPWGNRDSNMKVKMLENVYCYEDNPLFS